MPRPVYRGGGSILETTKRFLFRLFALLFLLPQLHEHARAFRALENVQVVESRERYLARSFDHFLQYRRIWASLALWIGVMSENVLAEFFKQKRIVVVVDGK